jgi:hypothetical protein
VGPPIAVPISKEDYDQAVAALASMIASWWREKRRGPVPDFDPGLEEPDGPADL